jgi:hypothetical protein
MKIKSANPNLTVFDIRLVTAGGFCPRETYFIVAWQLWIIDVGPESTWNFARFSSLKYFALSGKFCRISPLIYKRPLPKSPII